MNGFRILIIPRQKAFCLQDLRKQLREEIHKLCQVIPAKSHSKKGIEETLYRVILRGMPKDDEIHRILGVIKSSFKIFKNND